jgi:hypothetical protein
MSTATKPKAKAKAAKPKRIDVVLKAAVRRDRRTNYALSKATGVSQQQLGRWLLPEDDERHRGITLVTAALLAEALGLELRPVE